MYYLHRFLNYVHVISLVDILTIILFPNTHVTHNVLATNNTICEKNKDNRMERKDECIQSAPMDSKINHYTMHVNKHFNLPYIIG
jgi:hypothetical protein